VSDVTSLFVQGRKLHQSGRLGDAERIYHQILAKEPDHPGSLYLLGCIVHQRGNSAEAFRLIDLSLRKDPNNAFALNNLGNVLQRLNRFQEALASYDRALALHPEFIDALVNRANILNMLNRREEALASFDRALALRPDPATFVNRGIILHELNRYEAALASFDNALSMRQQPEAFANRGVTLHELKRYEAALASYDSALTLRPDFAEALTNRANTLHALGRFDEALASCDRALAVRPNLADALCVRGNTLHHLQRYEEALASFDSALALRPDYANALAGRGAALEGLKRFDEALASFDRALMLRPDFAEALCNRGVALHKLQRYAESLTSLDRALALQRDYAEAFCGRGFALNGLKRYDEALASFDRALTLKPDIVDGWLGRGEMFNRQQKFDAGLESFDRALVQQPVSADAWYGRAYSLFNIDRIGQSLAAFDEAISLRPSFEDAISSRIFALDFASDIGFEEHHRARVDWWQKVGAPIAARSHVEHSNSRDPDRRIRVGYVSADFRNHPTGRIVRSILLNHDRKQFEVTCYSSSDPEDSVTQEFKQAADRWRNALRTPNDELSAQIEADQIDILVDLSGHTAGRRLHIFAGKPAPVQVSAWGHVTGTGLPTIDYLFADPVICPQSVRHLFAETIFDLPCFLINGPLPDVPRSLEPPMLAKGHVTFGVFNRSSKISDDAVAVWSRLLRSMPSAQMLLKDPGYDSASIRDQVMGKFAAHGVSTDRIAFLGRTSRPDHLAAFGDIDIALDPFPMNGGVSTFEALQMGVPVLAKLGNTMASRTGGAIVTAVGLSDWVADSIDDYLAIAAKFAAMPEYLRNLRRDLPAMVAESAAGNPAKYTMAVESAYRTMWTHYCQSPP
jgi:predicted O-linked N-acetylglucosamine transferase (SPINDLY family)